MELIRVDVAPPVMPSAAMRSPDAEASGEGFSEVLASALKPAAESADLYGPSVTPSLSQFLPAAQNPLPVAAPTSTLEVTTHAAEAAPMPAAPVELPEPAAVSIPAPAPQLAPPAAPAVRPAPPQADANAYTVQAGDSLSKIARKLGGSTRDWKAIYAANRDVIGKNPNLIEPGQVLKLPAKLAHAAPVVASVTPAPIAQVPAPPPLPEVPAAPVVAAAPPAPVTVPVPAAVAPAAPVAQAPSPVAPAAVAPEFKPADAALEPAPPIAAPTAAPAAAAAPLTSSLAPEAQQAVSTIERMAADMPPASGPINVSEGAGLTYAQNLFAMREALKLVPAASPEYVRSNEKIAAYETALMAAVRPATTAEAGTGPKTP